MKSQLSKQIRIIMYVILDKTNMNAVMLEFVRLLVYVY